MKSTTIIFILLALSVNLGFSQEEGKKNSLGLSLGYAQLQRQDLIFSPFVHRDTSFPSVGIHFERRSKLYHKVAVNYVNFDPMLDGPFDFFLDGEQETAYPHSLNFVDLDYLIGKSKMINDRSSIIKGVLFSTNIQALNYVYGRISSFGYLATIGLGIFGNYEYDLNERNTLSVSLRLPLVFWKARSPYLVNDDEFIENISSHSGLKTFAAFLGDGKPVTLNRIQQFDLMMKYSYQVNERWGIGATYWLEFIHSNDPRGLLSFRNTLNFSGTYLF
ncbi:hypothetical protein [Pararhodonellum marinum]|uniref:hypothetical protein n=1 Tax=Pararhodonellum marinum TaxID=2755358 RepID=UPI00188E95CA|nr:hypothetical protein [Pararhodonellum marinum]